MDVAQALSPQAAVAERVKKSSSPRFFAGTSSPGCGLNQIEWYGCRIVLLNAFFCLLDDVGYMTYLCILYIYICVYTRCCTIDSLQPLIWNSMSSACAHLDLPQHLQAPAQGHLPGKAWLELKLIELDSYVYLYSWIVFIYLSIYDNEKYILICICMCIKIYKDVGIVMPDEVKVQLEYVLHLLYTHMQYL